VVSDAYYIPTKANSVLDWPFLRRDHLKRANAKRLLTGFCPTEDHVEAMHEIYEAHPEFLQELVVEPPLRLLLGAPQCIEENGLVAPGSLTVDEYVAQAVGEGALV
jgi:hypothetical protein